MPKIFYQITKNEKHTIKDKTNKSWKTIWNNELFMGVKIIRKILDHKK